MKKLLILGANPETTGVVIKAKEMGFVTFVTDNNPSAYAKSFADFSCDIDAADVEAIKKLIIEEKIDGVLCGVAEALVQIYAKVCLELNLFCFGSEELFNIFADKKIFKETCKKYNVPVVKEYNVDDILINNDYSKLKFPIIVKPVDSSSSKGISICNTITETKQAIEIALSFSPSKQIIIEKYMGGEEVVVYYAFQDGEPTLVAMCDRYVNNEQDSVVQLPTAYIFPSKHLNVYEKEVDKLVKNMFNKVGVKNGFMFLQAFIDKEQGISFYEAGYRLNGAQEHYILDNTTGIDAKECLINYALYGKEAQYLISERANPYLNDKYGCKLSVLVNVGQINKIIGIEEIKKIKEVISINPSYNEGDMVTGYGTLKQIICRFFIVSESLSILKNVIDEVYEKFDVIDESGKSMLLTQFDTNILEKSYEQDKAIY